MRKNGGTFERLRLRGSWTKCLVEKDVWGHSETAASRHPSARSDEFVSPLRGVTLRQLPVRKQYLLRSLQSLVIAMFAQQNSLSHAFVIQLSTEKRRLFFFLTTHYVEPAWTEIKHRARTLKRISSKLNFNTNNGSNLRPTTAVSKLFVGGFELLSSTCPCCTSQPELLFVCRDCWGPAITMTQTLAVNHVVGAVDLCNSVVRIYSPGKIIHASITWVIKHIMTVTPKTNYARGIFPFIKESVCFLPQWERPVFSPPS